MTKYNSGANIISALALVAQLDRVLDYESRGQGFESLLAHQKRLVRRDRPFCFLWRDTFLTYRTSSTDFRTAFYFCELHNRTMEVSALWPADLKGHTVIAFYINE